jgi:acetoin utilization protein AcuB
MEVQQIMTRSVVTATPQTTVREALTLLEDLEIRHLPIVDDGRLVGMVSDRDLREYRLPLLDELDNPDFTESLQRDTLSSVMSGHVISVDTGESLRSVVDAMIEYAVGALPVVDRHTEELEGIVSYVDILKALRADLDDT